MAARSRCTVMPTGCQISVSEKESMSCIMSEMQRTPFEVSVLRMYDKCQANCNSFHIYKRPEAYADRDLTPSIV